MASQHKLLGSKSLGAEYLHLLFITKITCPVSLHIPGPTTLSRDFPGFPHVASLLSDTPSSCRTESPAWLSSAPLLLQGALNWHEADHSTGIFPDWFLNAGSHQLYPARAGTRMSKQVLRKHVMTGPQRAGRPGLTKHNDQHRTFAYNHVCAHPCTL